MEYQFYKFEIEKIREYRMEKKHEKEIEELQGIIKKLEEEQETYEYEARGVLKEEEEEDMWLTHSRMNAERMRAECSPEDEKIQRLLYEKEDMISAFRRKKIEFDDEFREEVRRRKRQMENDMEELHVQISKIKHRQDEEKDEKNTEGKVYE